MIRSGNKASGPGPVELSEEELGEIAGGESAYVNQFQCIPVTVSATGAHQTDRIAATNPDSLALKG